MIICNTKMFGLLAVMINVHLVLSQGFDEYFEVEISVPTGAVSSEKFLRLQEYKILRCLGNIVISNFPEKQKHEISCQPST